MAAITTGIVEAGEIEVENRVAGVAGAEIEFLPETGRNMRDVGFAVFAEIRAVVVNDGGGVVINPLLLTFVDRNDEHDPVLAGEVAHELDGGAARDLFGRVVPARF